MANVNTISTMILKPRELNQGGTSTSETTFTSDGTLPVIAYLPNSGQLAPSCTLRVIARGRVTTGTTANWSVNLYLHSSATSATVTATKQIFGSGTVSLASLSTTWFAEATLTWDSTSSRLNGFQNSLIHLTHSSSATAVLYYPQTSISLTDGSVLGVVCTGTFSSGNASNAAYLDDFQIAVI